MAAKADGVELVEGRTTGHAELAKCLVEGPVRAAPRAATSRDPASALSS